MYSSGPWGPSIKYLHNFTCYLDPLPTPLFACSTNTPWKCRGDLTPPPPRCIHNYWKVPCHTKRNRQSPQRGRTMYVKGIGSASLTHIKLLILQPKIKFKFTLNKAWSIVTICHGRPNYKTAASSLFTCFLEMPLCECTGKAKRTLLESNH